MCLLVTVQLSVQDSWSKKILYVCRACEDSHFNVGMPLNGNVEHSDFSCCTSYSYSWHYCFYVYVETESFVNIQNRCTPRYTWQRLVHTTLSWSSSTASLQYLKLGETAICRTWDEIWERFQRLWILLEGFGAKICNLHFKHTLKSVPGRQPRSALTLVAGGPRWWSHTFSFKAPHMHKVFTALLWLTSVVYVSLFLCFSLVIVSKSKF